MTATYFARLFFCFAVVVCCARGHRSLHSNACEKSKWEDIINRDLDLLRSTRVYPTHLDIGQKQVFGGWRVLIHKQKLYALPIGEHNDPIQHPLIMLLAKSMCRYEMPDVEFVINAYSRKAATNATHTSVVFSCTKDPSKDQDVVLPYQSMLWPKSHAAAYADHTTPWEERIPKAVWRGTTSGGVFSKYTWRHMTRSRISLQCKERPDLCDVGFSSYDPQHTTPEAIAELTSELGTKEPVSMKDMAK
jgi:hypothetical protein